MYHTRNVAGHFTIGGKTYYFRSLLERRWACVLELCKRFSPLSEVVLGYAIRDWFYEPRKFSFDSANIKNGLKGKSRGVLDYRVDFQIVKKGGKIVWHETKGYMNGKSRTKLRCMHKYYPRVDIAVVVNGIPKGRTAKSRTARARLDFVPKLGYELKNAKPIFESLRGWFDKLGVDL